MIPWIHNVSYADNRLYGNNLKEYDIGQWIGIDGQLHIYIGNEKAICPYDGEIVSVRDCYFVPIGVLIIESTYTEISVMSHDMKIGEMAGDNSGCYIRVSQNEWMDLYSNKCKLRQIANVNLKYVKTMTLDYPMLRLC